MKKRIISTLTIAVSALLLTGCIRLDIGVTVNKDGTADLSVLMAGMTTTGDDNLNASSGNFSEEDIQKFKDSGFEAEPYEEDKYKGYTLKKTGISVTDLKNELTDLFKSDNDLEAMSSGGNFSAMKDGNKYTIEWKNIRKPAQSSSDSEPDTFSNMMSGMDVSGMIKGYGGYATLTLNLPKAADESNADEVLNDGKTLKWDLMNQNNPDIYVQFHTSVFGKERILFIGLWVLAGIAWAAAIFVFMSFLRGDL